MPRRRRHSGRSGIAGRAVAALTATGLLVLGGLMLSAWRQTEQRRSSVATPGGLLARPSVHGDTAAPGDASPEAVRPSDAVPADGADAEVPPLPDELRWFDGRPVRPARVLTMRVTAYSPDARSCAPFDDNVTASGYSVWTNGMKLVAADTDLLPFGSLVSVPGYDDGRIVPVLDRGARIKGHRLDVLLPTHDHARRWGVRDLPVVIWEYADDRPSDFRTGW
ncbi:MAG: 3D domain-containing protein [Planctomycetota bacterium]